MWWRPSSKSWSQKQQLVWEWWTNNGTCDPCGGQAPLKVSQRRVSIIVLQAPFKGMGSATLFEMLLLTTVGRAIKAGGIGGGNLKLQPRRVELRTQASAAYLIVISA